MTKKFLSLLLALLMALSLTAMAEAPIPASNELITVECLFPRMTNQPEDFSQMWFVEAIKEKMNVELVFELVEEAAFNERKALVLAAGNYPDIFFKGITQTDEQIYGSQGIFVDLTEMIDEHAVNMLALFEEYPDLRRSLTHEGGKIYSMPTLYTAKRDRISGFTGWYNKQWAENLGMKPPTTLDELYEMLVAFRDGDPNGNGLSDEIPLCYPSADRSFKTVVLSALGIVGLEEDVLDGRYVYVPMTGQYKSYLKYMNRLYAENLLDKDVFIMSPEEYSAKFQQQIVGIGNSTPSYNYLMLEEQWREYDRVPALVSEENPEVVWPGFQYVYRETGNFVVTDKCTYPEAMVKLGDFFYSQEGSLMVRAGCNRDEYPDVGGGWKILLDDEGNELASEIVYDTDKFISYWDFRCWNAPMSMTYNSDDYMGFVMLAGDVKSAFGWDALTNSRSLDILRINYPMVNFTEDEQSTLNLMVDLKNYVDSSEVKFITGEWDIDNYWDEYVSMLERIGVQSVIDVKQAAYERFMAG